MIGKWSKSIINHLYWCAVSTTDGNQDMIHDKWLSLINHIDNKHHHSGLFNMEGYEIVTKKWFKPRKHYVRVYYLNNDNEIFRH